MKPYMLSHDRVIDESMEGNLGPFLHGPVEKSARAEKVAAPKVAKAAALKGLAGSNKSGSRPPVPLPPPQRMFT